MTRRCCLNLLPVELFHNIFTYLLAHEILFSFSNISNYIDAILLSYDLYQLDFRITKTADFDVVRHRIQPNQIVSLILSDDNHSSGLSERFLSHFAIEQFVRLRSLVLHCVEIKSVKLIFSNLHQLEQLRIFSFDEQTIQHRYTLFRNNRNEFKNLFTQTYHRVFPRLRSLNFHHSNDLVNISLPYLHRLKLTHADINNLKSIFQKTPSLKSLDIDLYMNNSDSISFLPTNQLIQLNLTIHNRSITRDDIKQILFNVPHLKYLTLQTVSCHSDFINGYFLQSVSSSLLIFNFKFNNIKMYDDQILNTFRTKFWLEEKHWYVARWNNSLFSIPYFFPEHMNYNGISYFHSTVSNPQFYIDKYLKILTVDKTIAIATKQHRLSVETLIIEECQILSDKLKLFIDFDRIQCLTIVSIEDFILLEKSMINIKHLTIDRKITTKNIENIRNYRFESIRTLNIRLSDDYINYMIEELIQIFPFVEYFTLKSSVQSVDTLIRFINGFQQLSRASFYSDVLFPRIERQFCLKPYLIFHQLIGNITCQVYIFFNIQKPVRIHFQIDKQVRMNNNSRYRYYFHRCKYIVQQFFLRHLSFVQYGLQIIIYFLLIMFILKSLPKTVDFYFLGFCFIDAICLTILYNIFYFKSSLIQNESIIFAILRKISIWIVCCFIVFVFSFCFLKLYEYTFLINI